MSAVDEYGQRYEAAMHAVQSGVAMKMNHDGGPTGNGETSPKHLRVGVNAAMVDSAALAGLLMRKGVITEEEYAEALATQAEAEKALYERWLNDRFGQHPGQIRLG